VTIDAVSPPLGFGQIQSLDLTGWTGKGDDVRVTNVIASVRAKLAGLPPPAPMNARRRVLTLAAVLALVVPTIGFLADIATVQSVVCSVPGIRGACGRVGLGGVPTPEEEREWSERPNGDCQWLTTYLRRHPQGAYAEVASRLLLSGSQSPTEYSWQPEEHREPIHVSPLAGFRSTQAAQSDAVSRGQEAADFACREDSEVYRFRSAAVNEGTIKWQCTNLSGVVRCAFDAEAICRGEARHAVAPSCGETRRVGAVPAVRR
jgi:hypothetical protein